jgi:ATP-dependent helicase HepA
MHNTFNRLLQKATISLTAFLEKVLPPLFNDWWNEAVVNNLSFQQRRRTYGGGQRRGRWRVF